MRVAMSLMLVIEENLGDKRKLWSVNSSKGARGLRASQISQRPPAVLSSLPLPRIFNQQFPPLPHPSPENPSSFRERSIGRHEVKEEILVQQP